MMGYMMMEFLEFATQYQKEGKEDKREGFCCEEFCYLDKKEHKKYTKQCMTCTKKLQPPKH